MTGEAIGKIEDQAIMERRRRMLYEGITWMYTMMNLRRCDQALFIEMSNMKVNAWNSI